VFTIDAQLSSEKSLPRRFCRPICEKPRASRDALLAFYDFPAEHWKHLRTTNPIESTFATVRLRTKKTKGCGSRVTCLTMVYKLMMSAQKKWRILNGSSLLPEVIQGIKFIDGVKTTEEGRLILENSHPQVLAISQGG